MIQTYTFTGSMLYDGGITLTHDEAETRDYFENTFANFKSFALEAIFAPETITKWQIGFYVTTPWKGLVHDLNPEAHVVTFDGEDFSSGVTLELFPDHGYDDVFAEVAGGPLLSTTLGFSRFSVLSIEAPVLTDFYYHGFEVGGGGYSATATYTMEATLEIPDWYYPCIGRSDMNNAQRVQLRGDQADFNIQLGGYGANPYFSVGGHNTACYLKAGCSSKASNYSIVSGRLDGAFYPDFTYPVQPPYEEIYSQSRETELTVDLCGRRARVTWNIGEATIVRTDGFGNPIDPDNPTVVVETDELEFIEIFVSKLPTETTENIVRSDNSFKPSDTGAKWIYEDGTLSDLLSPDIELSDVVGMTLAAIPASLAQYPFQASFIIPLSGQTSEGCTWVDLPWDECFVQIVAIVVTEHGRMFRPPMRLQWPPPYYGVYTPDYALVYLPPSRTVVGMDEYEIVAFAYGAIVQDASTNEMLTAESSPRWNSDENFTTTPRHHYQTRRFLLNRYRMLTDEIEPSTTLDVVQDNLTINPNLIPTADAAWEQWKGFTPEQKPLFLGGVARNQLAGRLALALDAVSANQVRAGYFGQFINRQTFVYELMRRDLPDGWGEDVEAGDFGWLGNYNYYGFDFAGYDPCDLYYFDGVVHQPPTLGSPYLPNAKLIGRVEKAPIGAPTFISDHVSGGSRLYVTDRETKCWSSDNLGESWQEVPGWTAPFEADVLCLDMDYLTPAAGVYGAIGLRIPEWDVGVQQALDELPPPPTLLFARSFDAGLTWETTWETTIDNVTDTSDSLYWNSWSFAFFPAIGLNLTRLFIAQGGRLAWYSDDSGDTFSPITS